MIGGGGVHVSIREHPSAYVSIRQHTSTNAVLSLSNRRLQASADVC
jgi:hypothetical protein